MLFEFYKYLCDESVNKSIVTLPDDYPFTYPELFKFIEKLDLEYITFSDEINEQPKYGEYLYYYGTYRGLDFILHQSTHSFVWPSRIIIYDAFKEFNISDDSPTVEIYDANIVLLHIFQMDKASRLIQLKEWIKTTDRPIMIYT